MKKILFLLAAISLTLTSCLKEDENYTRLKPVMPGLNIYDCASTQQYLAMQPVNNVIRMGMLLAEGKLQEKTIEELPSMTLTYGENKTLNVFNRLFLAKTTLTATAEGNYVLEMKPESIGYYTSEGTITVETNEALLLDQTSVDHQWRVTLPPDYRVRIASADASLGYREVILEGAMSIYKSGAGYQIQIENMKAYMKESSSIASNWNGTFELLPPVDGEALAFSTCMDKKFGLSGSASGPTCITLNGTTGIDMFYSAEDGIYKNSFQCLDGIETAKLTGFGDYDMSVYPSPDVKITWTLSADERSITQTVDYNGYTVTR